MITKPLGGLELTSYNFDIALAKRRSGNLPLFTLVNQITLPSSQLDTEGGTVQQQKFDLRELAILVKATWGLNANPFVKMTFGVTADNYLSFVDFPGFSKNSVLGIRFNKELLNQSSLWIYGVTQYGVPRFDEERRSILVEGYGLLFEAPRRHTSKNFKNATAQSIISSIAKKYGLRFEVSGPLEDKVVPESEQNTDDFAMINTMASFLDAFWYLEENALILIGRGHAYDQKPEVTFFLGNSVKEFNFDTVFPITDFIPQLDGRFFEAGALAITARGIDLDKKEIVERVFQGKTTKMGSLSLNSDQFRTNDGVSINGRIVRPAPELVSFESGVFMPFYPRSNDKDRFQNTVEHKDIEAKVLIRVMGAPKVRPSMMVNVQGVGDILSGNYIVEQVTHEVENDGYVTDLILIRNALGQFESPGTFKTNLTETEDKLTTGERKFAEIVE